MKNLTKCALVAAMAMAGMQTAMASVTGASLDGSIGFVRTSFGEVETTSSICSNVVISNTGLPECAYSDAANTLTFNFTGTQMIVTQTIAPNRTTNPWTAYFYVHGLPSGASLTGVQVVSSTFPEYAPSTFDGGIHANAGFLTDYPIISNLSVSFGGLSSGGQSFTAVFNLITTPVPEPASITLITLGLTVLSLRRNKGAARAWSRG